MKPFPIPVVALGPGTQPIDEELEFIRLPEMQAAFRMPPRPLDSSTVALAEARAFLADLHSAAARHAFGGNELLTRDVMTLGPAALALVNEVGSKAPTTTNH